MSEMFRKQLRSIEKKEKKILEKPENTLMKENIRPLMDKIESKIPDKLRETLFSAFLTGFKLVFEQGTKIIDKTYDKEKLALKYEVNDYAVNRLMSRGSVDNMEREANRTALLNASISVVEGGVLGVLGIGLPDIPVLIGMIVKTLHEMAISYGIDPKSEKEQYYLMLLINGAMAKKEEQQTFSRQADHFAMAIERGEEPEYDNERMMRLTARILSDAMLTAKFIQGFAIVGVVGAAVNYSIIRRISEYAGIKYKKRYVIKKIRKQQGG